MKKKSKWILTAFILTTLLLVGNAAASFLASISTEQNVFMGNLGLELHVVGKDGKPVEGGAMQGLSPGTFEEYRVSVSNETDNAFYCRIRIDKCFLNEQNKKTTNPGADNLKLAVAQEVLSEWYIDGWDVETAETVMKTGADGVKRTYVFLPDDAFNHETVIAYYRNPLEKGESTSQLMDYIYLSSETDNEIAGKNVSVSVETDAVQSVAGVKAIQAEWGLDVSIDDSGRITELSD